MNEYLQIGAKALRSAALNDDAKHFILNNAKLYGILRKAANRYIGGESLVETLPKVIYANSEGYKCSIEFMGENVRTESEADEATIEFINIVRHIENRNLDCTIALDLSHIGLGISRELGLKNLIQICDAAKRGGIEVIISAEGTDMTDAVLETYITANKDFDLLGITLQAYLYRSRNDMQELLKTNGRIRIVKGAFETPPGYSIPRGSELDAVYLSYVDDLLSHRHKCSIATHHHDIQQHAKTMVDHYKPSKSNYEFESLYGIQSEQLLALKEEGYMTKLYFVYGREWYLYLCNRIAEYPLNIFKLLEDITL
ncbi:proline dehydrogenase family protein [Flavobacterium sp. 1355]|uniref:proline dehydrogenase family protein n=1 Tax=Flavobacterium sp. 1355 TaxID=2806571 RepID=UPI001AE7EE93|nr:proline dehydrogenase family protein [Flavobacterium sp. 1355]MBP1225657.1 proline dehydrogenase [Flavobacterium sp. 1355]